jgi:hypothetical protein
MLWHTICTIFLPTSTQPCKRLLCWRSLSTLQKVESEYTVKLLEALISINAENKLITAATATVVYEPFESVIMKVATSTITTEQRKSVMSKLHNLLQTLQQQLDDNNDDIDSDADSNFQAINDKTLRALIQHIECSQYNAATDTTAYNDNDTLLSKWQYVAEQFLTELQTPMVDAGKGRERTHSAVYVAKPQYTTLRNEYADAQVRWQIEKLKVIRTLCQQLWMVLY